MLDVRPVVDTKQTDLYGKRIFLVPHALGWAIYRVERRAEGK
jgi:hypothetical protein